ncbi:MAG TPA: SH3 domain-containing protein [Clostridiales bacterium]|nr:SH3 domain-containing protein [Clostridiales bacterium]
MDDVKKKVSALTLSTVLALTVLPFSSSALAAEKGVVTGSVVNVRSSGSLNAKIITQAKKGTELDVIKKSGDWYNVKLPSKTVGWMYAQYIALKEKTSGNNVTGNGTVTGSAVRVRSGPSTSKSIIGLLYRNAKVKVIGKQGSWYKVQLSNGKEGYMHSDYVKVNTSVPESTSRSKGESSNNESSKTAKGTITASALRVRSGPGTNYSTLTTYKRNTTVNILGKCQGSGGLWYKISYPGGKEAWVSAQYVKASGTIPNVDGPSSKKTDAKDESNLPVGTVTGSVVNIRSVPSTSNNKPIATVNKGQQLKIVGEKNGWFQVILPNGTKGWITGQYFVKGKVSDGGSTSRGVKVNTTVSKLISLAKSLLGTPYVYGGSSPSGFDCSGFTYYIFKQFGAKIPRTATDQGYNLPGDRLSKSQLKQGDLVFFKTRSGSSACTHVGIYLGNNQFIHSASPRTGGVIISSMNESYYKSRFSWGKRVEFK